MEEEDIKTADDVAADVDQSRQPPPPDPSIPTTSSTASSTSQTTTPTTTASMSKAAVPVSGPGIAATSTAAAPSGDLDDVGDLFGGGVELEKNFDIHKILVMTHNSLNQNRNFPVITNMEIQKSFR